MRSRPPLGKLVPGLAVLAVLAMAVAAPLQARTATLAVERIDTAAGHADGVELRLRWADDAREGALELAAARIESPLLGYRLRDVRWQCPLQRRPGGWHCEGAATSAGLRRGTMQVVIDESAARVALRRGDARLQLQRARGDGGIAIESRALPLDWLQPLLSMLWEDATLSAGRIDARLRFDPDIGGASRLDGRIEVTGLDFDTADGRTAAAGLSFAGPLQLRWPASGVAFDTTLQLAGGEVLVDPLYAELPTTPVELALRGSRDGDVLRLQRLRLHDEAALTIDGTLTLHSDATDPLRALELTARSPDLARAQSRYLGAVLGASGAGALSLAGAAQARLYWQPGGVRRIDATFDRLSIEDADGRFGVADAVGSLAWNGGDSDVSSRLRWRAASLYGISLGAAELDLLSRDRGLRLAAPLRLDMLGGALTLQRMAWWPAHGEASPELDFGLQLHDLDLQALATRFGWPAFSGRLGGVIPAAHYEDGVLRFDGGLEIGVFDGRVDVAALRLERPFGVAPRLHADIRLHALNLQPLTSVFGFGEISGRMDGRIDGLQLLDWRPVAFDAQFITAAGREPRRISQRAVDDLTRIGGGGIAGGVQASLLRMFDTFGYARIGLSCRLSGGVCIMGGLDSAAGGYTIVEGAGVPRITVRGFQRRVDWAVLMARLQAATAGQPLRIE